MSHNNSAISAKKAVQNYIETASHFEVKALSQIYHKELKIIEIHERGNVRSLDKAEALNFFQTKLDESAKPLSTETEFNYVEATKTQANIVVTRKTKPVDERVKSVVSMNLIWEDNRWKIIQQTVFVHPIT